MDTRIENWHTEIDQIISLFEKSFSNLDEQQLNWKPNPEGWSIGEVIEHLIKTSNSYFKIPETIKDPNFKPSIFSNFPFIANMIGNMILKSVHPNAKRKVKTFNAFTPNISNVDSNILENFIDTQKQLHNLIHENEESILSRKIIPSPVSKHIVYHFDTVIDILVNHQKRHFNQASNVLKEMKKNG